MGLLRRDVAKTVNEPIISVRDLGIGFPGKQRAEPIQVLRSVNLEVRRGEFVCIVGPSGCGKTTLLNIIAGFIRQSKGEILVQGTPVTGPDPKRIFVFQDNGVFPWLTVEQNIGFGLSRRPRDERRGIVHHYVQMVGLTGFERAYPRELSGGMRQRVEIARALAPNPEIIYMDEPFGALDAQTRGEMQQLLLRIWDETASTILFVTHDVEEAIYLADRIFIMSAHPGTIVEDLQVPFERPRTLELKQRNEFHELQNYVLGRLRRAPGSGQVRVSV